MPGLLTHLSVAFLGFLVVFLFSNYKYGLVFIFGHVIPDAIKFGVPGVMFRTISFYEIVSKDVYSKIMNFTDNIFTWVVVCVLIFLVVFVLWKLKKISLERFKKWIVMDVIFFVAIAIHLILDVLIIEKSYWI